MEITAELLQLATDNGMIELSNGSYLYTQEQFIADQATWDDKDKFKNEDFTTSLYWLSTNDGIVLPISEGDEI